jgi:hypothetical protein
MMERKLEGMNQDLERMKQSLRVEGERRLALEREKQALQADNHRKSLQLQELRTYEVSLRSKKKKKLFKNLQKQ